MDEALFARLAQWLPHEAVVLAEISETVGNTPRKRGSRMLVTRERAAFSVGGGLAEARVIDAARELLADAAASTQVAIDLGGGAGAAGICGGRMQIVLRRWAGDADLALAHAIAADLAAGRRAELPATAESPMETLQPNPRLLIVGAGHCGLALYELARHLDFDIAVFDSRNDCFAAGEFDGATILRGDYAVLATALETERAVYAVLLNRDFGADIATLDVLCRQPPEFLGMMGSRRRIRQVVDALPQHAQALESLQAPIGLAIAAETPHEIAVSILAQLIAHRRRG